MSQQNVELMEAGMAQFMATGEPDWSTTHQEVVVYDHDILDAGEYRGHDGYRRWLEDWAAAWSEFTLEPEEFIDADERVIVVLRMKATGRGSGVTLERQDALVVELRDGLAVRIDYFNDKEQALEAVGVAE
jgi:ketosteroid isomerase-like protein